MFKIKNRTGVPAGFRSIRPHAFRDNAQPRRTPRLGRQLQPPPLAQIQRTGYFEHHMGQRPVFETLFGHRKRVQLILGAGQQHLRRIKERQHPLWRQGLGQPRLPDPKHRPPCGQHRKPHGSGPADLMDAGTAQGKNIVKLDSHECEHKGNKWAHQ